MTPFLLILAEALGYVGTTLKNPQPLPKFIVFEGLDGSGKSTLISKLITRLKEKNQDVVSSREPGGSPLGEQIRQILTSSSDHPMDAWSEMFLFSASRRQHVIETIQPALEENKWVLLDRYTASSIAFQGGGRGLDVSYIQKLNELSTNNLKASLTVLLDLSVQEAEKRRQNRVADRIEKESALFHERVRNSFLEQAKSESSHWLILDASLSPDALFEQLWFEVRIRWTQLS